MIGFRAIHFYPTTNLPHTYNLQIGRTVRVGLFLNTGALYIPLCSSQTSLENEPETLMSDLLPPDLLLP